MYWLVTTSGTCMLGPFDEGHVVALSLCAIFFISWSSNCGKGADRIFLDVLENVRQKEVKIEKAVITGRRGKVWNLQTFLDFFEFV